MSDTDTTNDQSPDVQAQSPDTSAIQTTTPDTSDQQIQPQDDQQTMPLQGTPVSQQAPQQPQQSTWQRILTGALVGLSGTGGARNFAQGMVGGAQASVNYAQQQHENQVQQQQQDMEKQRLALQTQTAGDDHAAAQQNLAVSQANLAILHANYNTMPKTVQEALDQADMKMGQTLKDEGNPVISGQNGLSYQDAQQRIMAERSADPNSALQYVMHARPDGNYDVFQITNPDKTNDTPLDVTIGYDANTGKPITKTYQPHSISIAQVHNLETNAAVNYAASENDMESFKKKNAIQVGGEIQVAKAKQQMDESPVYAIDASGNTVFTTKAAAIQNGMSGIRPVKEADIRADQKDIGVINDMQLKANNVYQAASAMDKTSWAQTVGIAKYLADNPNTTAAGLANSAILNNVSPQARNYAIAVTSLRESAMSMQKLLTGSARSNETQINALLKTLPNVEGNSGIVNQKLGAFTQNLQIIGKSLPKGTGVELQGFGGGQQNQQPQAAAAPPQGATGKVRGSDGNMYWTDGKNNLGRAN
jgi:hypothetical protein